ncbi:hypothetical protein NMG60_11020559 [Bertholletia excelsa]
MLGNKMDKVCEFCMSLRPIVYCKADAAYLCLFCDAKVHSANALSNRHPRTLVCEACRYRPAYVQCSDHKMFMCDFCDCNLHKDSSRHQKRLISSYMGCPSAKDFAMLWGFELRELENDTPSNQFVLTSCVSVDTGMKSTTSTRTVEASLASHVGSVKSFLGQETEVGPSSQHNEVFKEDKQEQNACIILQQIIDLERLQLSDGDQNSSLIRGKQQTDSHSSLYDPTWKLENDVDQSSQHLFGLGTDPHQELDVEPFSSSFAPLEQLTSNSTVGNPLEVEPFWQCKSPAPSFQLWSQNMQDLGICEELAQLDDTNIPEVDLTFQNFEELFGCDQDLTGEMHDDKDVTCSSVDKETSLEGSEHSCPKEFEQDISPADQDSHCFASKGCCRPIRPSYSTLSLSLSRFSAESNSADCLDSFVSPVIGREEPPCNSLDQKSTVLDAKGNPILRYKDKQKVQRCEKQIRNGSRKAKVDTQRRVRGRFVKAENYESDEITVTRSY